MMMKKKMLSSIYKFRCRCCGSKKLKRVLSLGYQPLANNLLNSDKDKAKTFPLELNVCEQCFNCQLSVAIKSEDMFSNYFINPLLQKLLENILKKQPKNIFMILN